VFIGTQGLTRKQVLLKRHPNARITTTVMVWYSPLRPSLLH
jgi:hypothetical protein